MRASEFINEDMHAWQSCAIKGMKTINNTNQFYDLYRFGLAMADSGTGANFSPDGTTEDKPVLLSYSDGDEAIINDALKKVGGTATQLTARVSSEPPDTNIRSIVAVRGSLPRRN